MNLKSKISKSHIIPPSNLSEVQCLNVDEPLIRVDSSDLVMVDPIWVSPTDEFEGRLYQDYIANNPSYDGVYARREVAERLEQAASSLPANMQLVLRACHRPIEVQQKLLDQLTNSYVDAGMNYTDALDTARLYVSDPTLKLPPHCCGASVDVDILDRNTAKLLDFGTVVNTDSERSFLHSNDISAEQTANRAVLLKAMLDAGFASYYQEWWHYSYGDQLWAWFYSKPSALYGIIDKSKHKLL